MFEHGEHVSGSGAALNAAKQNRINTVIGHQHSFGGVSYIDNFDSTLWGMNTGCMIDTTRYAFNYAKKFRNKPTLGTGVIVDGVPHFIPIRLDGRGKWIGKI